MAGAGRPVLVSDEAAAFAARRTIGHSSCRPAFARAGDDRLVAEYQDQTAHGTQPEESSSVGRPSCTGPVPDGRYLAAQIPSAGCTRCKKRRISNAVAGWPVPARAAATKLESRGQVYSQPGCQAARTAPSDCTASRRSSRARVASCDCSGVLPGTVPARSQAWSARTAAAAQADSAALAGTTLPGAAKIPL